MTRSNGSAPSRRKWHVATTAVVLLASVTWARCVGAVDAPRRIGAGPVWSLVADPRTPATLYAATQCGGVLQSTDGGDTWIVAYTGLGGDIVQLTIDPITPSTLYASCQFGSSCSIVGIFKSTDSARSWQAVNTGLPPNTRVSAIAIDPANGGTLYVAVVGGDDRTKGVFKSTDGASTWQDQNSGRFVEPQYVVTALIIDSIAPSTLYAAAAGPYGVFKSTDGAGTWAAFTDGIAGYGASALAIDPIAPNTLYVGSNTVYKSTDGARSWQAASTGLPNSARLLAVDPTMPGTLYAASGRVYKSTDGAGSWQVASAGLPANPSIITVLASDPIAPGTLFYASLGAGGGLFKSTDGAATWSVSGLAEFPICGDSLRCNEECDDGNTVSGDGCDANCTVTPCGNGNLDAGEQCDDGNRSNEDACRDDCRPNVCGDGFRNPASEQCDDGNDNPFDGCTNACTICGDGIVTPPEECEDGNTDPFDGCTTACTRCGNGVVTPPEQCDDGNRVDGDRCDASCTTTGCGNAIVQGDEECDDGNTVGGDGCAANCTTETTHRLVLDSEASHIGFQTAVFGFSSPISGSVTLRLGHPREGADSRMVPVAVRAEDISLGPISIAGLSCFCIRGTENSALGEAIAGSGSISCAGAVAGVDVVTSIDHNTNTRLFDAVLAIDPVTPRTLYAGTNGSGIFKSTDAGGTWTEANGGLTNTRVIALAIDPITPHTLYASMSGSGGVFKSTDAGATWGAANLTGILTGGTVVVLAIDPITSGTLYVGGDAGGLFKSTDAGATWAEADVGLGTSGVSALAIDPITPRTLYASMSSNGGVFKSTDAGATWGATGLSGVLSGHVLVIDPITPRTLYAGVDGGGIFKSTNAGATWGALNVGTNTGVVALTIDPIAPSTLYAGTRGGGVFKSTTAGARWGAANAGLTNTYVGALAIDPTRPSTLYGATRVGVFKSTDSGGSWNAANEGVDPACAAGLLEDGSVDHPHLGVCNGPEEVTFSGAGPAGSARIDLRLESWSIRSYGGACDVDPFDPARGPDGILCTDDDPGRAVSFALQPRGFGGPSSLDPLPPEFVLRLTTGGASAKIEDVNNQLRPRIAAREHCGGSLCVTEVAGVPTICEALAPRLLETKLAGAIAVLDRQAVGDLVATFALSAAPPVCAGDCDGGGAVTVDELISGVNIALGNSAVSSCDIGDVNRDGQITVDEIITAVSLALEGCL